MLCRPFGFWSCSLKNLCCWESVWFLKMLAVFTVRVDVRIFDPRTGDVFRICSTKSLGINKASIFFLNHPLIFRDYRITVFATCHTIRRNYGGLSASSEFARPYLCRQWQRLVKHRLLCSRVETVNSMPDSVKGNEEERRQVFSVQCTSSSFQSQRSSSFYVSDGGVQFV